MRTSVRAMARLILTLLVAGLLFTATGALAAGVSDDRLYFEPRLGTVPEPELPALEPAPAPADGDGGPKVKLPTSPKFWLAAYVLVVGALALVGGAYLIAGDPIWGGIAAKQAELSQRPVGRGSASIQLLGSGAGRWLTVVRTGVGPRGNLRPRELLDRIVNQRSHKQRASSRGCSISGRCAPSRNRKCRGLSGNATRRVRKSEFWLDA